MKTILLKLSLAAAVLVMSVGIASAALSVDAAKHQGLVGERADGLLGAVNGGSGEVNALVQQTNSERMARYNAIASKNGTGIQQVQAIAGKKLIDNAKPGEYIQNGAGGWQQK